MAGRNESPLLPDWSAASGSLADPHLCCRSVRFLIDWKRRHECVACLFSTRCSRKRLERQCRAMLPAWVDKLPPRTRPVALLEQTAMDQRAVPCGLVPAILANE